MILCSDLRTKLQRPVCPKCDRCLTAKGSLGKSFTKLQAERLCKGCMFEKRFGKRHPFKKSHKYQRPWVIFKKESCESCGFIPKHQCQLDVDHIDGNKKNNNSNNFQTLCSNCHRLKTHLNGDSNGYRKR